MREWYRRKTWTETDKEEFFKKLNQAHKSSRAKYLKVQAIELIATNDLQLIVVAEKLLLKVLNEYTYEKIYISQTYNSLGNIYEIRNELEIALCYYKKSLDFENEYPNVITTSLLDYSKLIIKLEKINLYEDLKVLLLNEINKNRFMFPIELYTIYSILATISLYYNDVENAKLYTNITDENALKRTNSLWNPKKNKLGLVSQKLTWLNKFLK